MTPGLVIAAPASGSGKTVVTLGLLRALRAAGVAVASCKVGPDYIDPRFHEAASGRPCRNLDPWAMRPATLARLAVLAGEGAELLVVEGVMGLFDGAADGSGSTADLAALAGWPVVLVLDVGRQGPSAAAVLHGFRSFRDDVEVAGVILNRVGSASHEAQIRNAISSLGVPPGAPPGVPVLGAVQRDAALDLPHRHLGLVQAEEHAELDMFLARAGAVLGASVDLAALRALARPGRLGGGGGEALPPLGQRIAVARDAAFAFAYPHLLEGWRQRGAELLPFSPLADEGPDAGADAVFLPGGYPELHAGRLAGNGRFLEGVRAAAARGAAVYGECGGYMTLGETLVDGDGTAHAMAGLLPVATSFARRRLHLGYRRAVTMADGPWGPRGTVLRGHEFHYASTTVADAGAPLFQAWDARGTDLGAMGSRRGTVCGSFLHVVDAAG
ncbi:cobyrinate a,c-diamide synthase [Azospirillum sp.]|uniref:cobyrinate a,c-diamide synthase n=1 Tax=Azospirillum sp. TaxID=34012 RepID=UPI002D62566E|nr:cobyrinate a,c-diamide synthase [Azospirillum sp.]HYD65213.1 cobyrinate a,c-diamide synthase [Azospirillum sp.]